MREHIYNYLPVRKQKNVMFSVRITDDEHKKLLALAAKKGECRAVMFAELAQIGAERLAEEMGLTDRDIDKLLIDMGMIVDDTRSA